MEKFKTDEQRLMQLVSDCRQHLESLNYSPHSVTRKVTTWNQFIKYCCRNRISNISFSVGQEFINEHYGYGIKQGYKDMLLHSVKVLCEYTEGIPTLRRKIYEKTFTPPKPFELIYGEFVELRQGELHSKGALKNSKLCTLYFLRYLEDIKIVHFENVEISHVLNFIELKNNVSLSYKAHVCVELRKLTTFAFEKEYMQKNLSFMIPRVLYNRKSNIPFAMPKDDVEKILCSVNRELPMEKRDYAILVLAAKLGIRSGDICNLNFTNINWRTNQIKFVQEKTKKEISLPMSNQIGEAIIDYLKNGRPISDSSHLFVRHNAPFDFLNSPSTHHIFNKYLMRAKISTEKGRPHGLHCLRHSVASELLNNNTTMIVVSEILGHADLETTNIYSKIDIKQLRKCSLEVPAFEK